jgi:hypothetical protein
MPVFQDAKNIREISIFVPHPQTGAHAAPAIMLGDRYYIKIP